MSSLLKTSGHAAFKIFYHVIFTVKYRKKCISKEMLPVMQETLAKVCSDWRCKLIEFNGESDHVHMLIEAHPALDLSRMIGNLKTVSARKMRSEFASHLQSFYWKPLFWNSAYAVVSVGSHANLETVMKYIQDQDNPD